MKSNTSNDAVLSKLDEIATRLARQEALLKKLVASSAEPSSTDDKAGSAEMELFLMRLSKLTLKRHAVLTATLGNMSYQQIADLMQCDTTTVKLHLRNALQILGIASRSILLTSHANMLDQIDDKTYRIRFGISKRWWLGDDPAVMSVLRTTRLAANQHTKEKGNAEAD